MSFQGEAAVVLCVDKAYMSPAAVLIASLIRNSPRLLATAAIVVLVKDIDRGDVARLVQPLEAAGASATVLQVDQDLDGPVGGWVSAAVYLRLLIPDLIDATRVLYLDVDTIATSELLPLLETELHGNAIGAVRDAQHPLVGRGIALPGWRELGVPEGRDYFNSGVMVLDIEQCKATRLCRRALELLTLHPGYIQFWDQDALNWAANDRWERLDRTWNHPVLSPLTSGADFTHAAGEQVEPLDRLLAGEHTAALLHYAGPLKPWRPDYPESLALSRYRAYMEFPCGV